MKNSKNKFSKLVTAMVIVLAMVATTDIYAQGNPPGGSTNTIDVPLDGGLIALVIAGVFGVKKLRDNMKS